MPRDNFVLKFKTKVSGAVILIFIPGLYNIWKDQLYRISGYVDVYEWPFGTFEKRVPNNVSRALLLHVRKVKFVTAMTNEPAQLSSRSRYRDAGILANRAENFSMFAFIDLPHWRFLNIFFNFLAKNPYKFVGFLSLKAWNNAFW